MLTIKTVDCEDQLRIIDELAATILPEVYKEIMPSDDIQFLYQHYHSFEALKQNLKEGVNIKLLFEEDEPIGYLTFIISKQCLQIEKLYFTKNFRNKGYGNTVFSFIDELMRNAKLNKQRLVVHKANTKAISFYKKKATALKLSP